MCDLKQCLKLSVCICLGQFIWYANILCIYMVCNCWLSWNPIYTNIQNDVTHSQLETCVSWQSIVNNIIHLWDKNLFCNEIIKSYNTLISVVVKSSFWWNCVLCVTSVVTDVFPQLPLFLQTSPLFRHLICNYWLCSWLLYPSRYQRQCRLLKPSSPCQMSTTIS